MESLWIAFSIALGLAAGQPAVAQDKGKPPLAEAQDERTKEKTPESTGERKNGSGKQAKVDRDDREFMEKAARLGHAELAASKLAATRASSQEVKDFARQMVEDHTRSSRELQALASSKGVKLPASPDRGHAKDLRKLEGLSGAEFDREYMAGAGVKDHDRTVDLFRDAQKDTKDPDVKAFIDKTLPVLQKHHQRAKTVHASVKDGKSSAVGSGKEERKSDRKRSDKDAK
jgi:putative membrane protein